MFVMYRLDFRLLDIQYIIHIIYKHAEFILSIYSLII